MTLTGQVQGHSRQDLETQARNEAKTYYGTGCVTVSLTNETAETPYIVEETFNTPADLTPTLTTYTADYVAVIDHRWQTTGYESPTSTCIDCKKEKQ